MTNAYSLRALAVSLAFVGISLAMVAVQYVVSIFVSGASDSAGLRVSAAVACSAEDAHFTGCSSIL